jgi:hypothetical protein
MNSLKSGMALYGHYLLSKLLSRIHLLCRKPASELRTVKLDVKH